MHAHVHERWRLAAVRAGQGHGHNGLAQPHGGEGHTKMALEDKFDSGDLQLLRAMRSSTRASTSRSSPFCRRKSSGALAHVTMAMQHLALFLL